MNKKMVALAILFAGLCFTRFVVAQAYPKMSL